MNGDKDLANQLKYTHALRTYLNNPSDQASYRIFYESLLYREMGAELNLFSTVTEGPNDQTTTLVYQGDNAEIAKYISDNEQLLHERIVNCFADRPSPDYEIEYSYKNGIVVEKGQGDLDSVRKNIASSIYTPLK